MIMCATLSAAQEELLGLESNLNRISYEDRYVQVDAFPMGIDYARFSKEYDDPEFQAEIKEIDRSLAGERMILSIDRLDYTKGIPGRIKAFGLFLEKYPEYQGKVRLTLIVAPSRTEVDTYDALRKEITDTRQRNQREIWYNGMDADMVFLPELLAGKSDCLLQAFRCFAGDTA